MSTRDDDSAIYGATFFRLAGELTIVFAVLRLCEVTDWSWWWVLSPLWIPLLVVLAGLIVAVFIGIIGLICERVASSNG